MGGVLSIHRRNTVYRMEHAVLTQGLSLAALIAASAEYAGMIRRRAYRRDSERMLLEACLRGLVRLEVLAEGSRRRFRR